MLEVVRLIKSTQDELDEIYKKYINPAPDARSMVSLYNPNSGYTINGAKASEVNEEIRDIDKRISMTLEKLEIITSIKEQVNSSKSVTIYDEDGNPIESAPHARQIVKMKLGIEAYENYILRKPIVKG